MQWILLGSDWASPLCSGLPLQAGLRCPSGLPLQEGLGCPEAVALCLLPFACVYRGDSQSRSCWAGLTTLGLCVALEVGPWCQTFVKRVTVFRAGLCSHTTVTPDGWRNSELGSENRTTILTGCMNCRGRLLRPCLLMVWQELGPDLKAAGGWGLPFQMLLRGRECSLSKSYVW